MEGRREEVDGGEEEIVVLPKVEEEKRGGIETVEDYWLVGKVILQGSVKT